MPEPLPPEAPEAAVFIHPGDLVQITDQAHEHQRAILMVTETYSWGLGATMQAIVDGRLSESYQRLRVAQAVVVGTAALMPPEVLQLRKASIETQRELAREVKP